MRGDGESRAGSHEKFSESQNRDSGEVGEEATLARFLISLLNPVRCRTSEQQTVVKAGVKKRRRQTT
jgi:hypothetical protein